MKFIKYLVVGLLSVAVYTGLLMALESSFTSASWLINLAAYSVATVVNYLLNYYIVFNSRKNHSQTTLKFISTVALGLLLNSIFVHILHEKAGVDLVLSGLIFSAVWPLISFTLMSLWIFK